MNRQGSATLMVVSILLGLSVTFLATAALIQGSARGLARSRLRSQEAALLRAEATLILEGLLADPTPFADSPRDPVWLVVEASRGRGFDARLEDISSRLGLNWIRKEVLADSGALRPGRAAEEVQETRERAGPRLALEQVYGDLVAPEAMQRVFTAYGWFNVNISDEFVLRAVHRARGSDPSAAEQFHLAVQQARVARRVVRPQDLGDFLGAETWNLLYPIVNADPPLNIHFVPEQVLEILFRHYQVPPPGLQALLGARRNAELTPSDRDRLLAGPAGRQELSAYLGLRTWFWRITVSRASRSLAWVVARVPRGDDVPEFRLLEEGFSP